MQLATRLPGTILAALALTCVTTAWAAPDASSSTSGTVAPGVASTTVAPAAAVSSTAPATAAQAATQPASGASSVSPAVASSAATADEPVAPAQNAEKPNEKHGGEQAGGTRAAQKAVVKLQDALIYAMRNGKKLGYKGRYAHLDPVVRKAFDFPFISRIVMGVDWRKLDAPEKHALQEALAKLSVSSFAKEFVGYSGQHFVYDSSRTIGGGVLVRYVFHSGKDRMNFDYQMHRDAGGHWKIANVIVDGVSDLALKSGQYRALFAKKGYEALIAWIDKQIKANAA